jgi:acetyltransferase-like isoleucine patch superfamily enzyme
MGMEMNESTGALLSNLRALHHALREHTKIEYGRINPFYEDLFDWRERAAYWLGEEKGVTIYNSTTLVGQVDIGEHTWIGPFCSLDGTGGLTIGSYCSISLGCQILTHDTVRWALSRGKAAYEYAPTKIGDCCFLGCYAVVLKGVTIEDHCVIGAGAVVTENVPAYSIVAGVPAHRIGKVHVDENEEIWFQYDMRGNPNTRRLNLSERDSAPGRSQR